MGEKNGQRRVLILAISGIAVWYASLAVIQAQTGSAQAAKELASLMAERQLDAFAAPDPESPSRFLATLLIPNVQMLVVSAEYPTPTELQSQLAQKNYRDVYAALHQPASAQSRFFLIDLACDGLRGGGESVDVLYEKGTTQTLFNGDWTKQGLSEQSYKQRLKDAELRYARILAQLRDSLKSPAAGTAVQK
jgi:hypothetical protein